MISFHNNSAVAPARKHENFRRVFIAETSPSATADTAILLETHTV